jgi:hypothetical protein
MKQNQILAKTNDRKSDYNAFFVESNRVFGNEHLLTGKLRIYKHSSEGTNSAEIEEIKNMEKADSSEELLTTTVDERLTFQYKEGFEGYIDALLSRNLNNCEIKVEVKSEELGIDLGELPVTSIMDLKTELKKLAEQSKSIPTLPSGYNWKENDDEKKGTWKFGPSTKIRNKDIERFEIVTEATDKHRAQYERVNLQIQIGIYEDTTISGKWTSERLFVYRKRLTDLIEFLELKQLEANSRDIAEPAKIAIKLTDYLIGKS